MKIFDFEDYRAFIRNRVQNMPKRGRGELQRMSEALRIHSTRMSQILSGSTNLTPEQAGAAAQHMGLTELEAEYFLALVHRERAGTAALRSLIDSQLRRLRDQAQQVVHRVQRDKILSDQDRATFYSTWHYSAIRLATSVGKLQTLEALAQYFELPRARVAQILEFLLGAGLCLEDTEGRITLGPKRTHLEHTSPLANRHHANWRLKAIERHERLTERELAYTGTMSLGPREQKWIREQLLQLIEKATQAAVDSEPEKLVCLNLDWFEF